jgi:hypothetical protein
MQAFYMVSEVNLHQCEFFKVYAEDQMSALAKLKAWLATNMSYYPSAPGNINFESHPAKFSKESRQGWRYLVK